MITLKRGDILLDDAQVLVNPVNSVGVMGAGLALAFKKKYPHNFYQYKKFCEVGGYTHRNTMIVHTGFKGQLICNALTKEHWSNPSSIDLVRHTIKELAGLGAKSMAVPKLGCGLGGLTWSLVYDIMVEEFTEGDYRIYI